MTPRYHIDRYRLAGAPPHILAACAAAVSYLGLPLDVRMWLATWAYTAPEALAELTTDPEIAVSVPATHHPNTPPAALAALTASPDPSVRTMVACLPGTPKDALDTLEHDQDPRVRTCAALNKCRLYLLDLWGGSA